MRLRKHLRDRYLKQIERIKEIPAKDLSASAIIFSPHQDDETLGCGGTIIRKREAGAEVKIVFMTDGSQSHHHFTSESELIALRQQEAIKAAQTLKVAEEDVIFFGFLDGELSTSATKAIALLTSVNIKN